jgi:hypothetical protein
VSGDQPPPPGWMPPPGPHTTGQPPPYSGWGQQTPPPGWGPGAAPPGPQPYAVPPAGPAAHKPGAIPLRPLVLGDIFDGAFRIIRYNPKATIGAAVLVSAVAMVLPVVVGLVTGSTGNLSFGSGDQALTHDQVIGLVSAFGSFFLATQLQSIGLLFVSGMIAHVTSAAAVGRRLTMGEAWAATAGKRWRLLGMAFLLGLATVAAIAVVAGVVVFLAFHAGLGVTILTALVLGLGLVVAYLVFWVRVRALAVPTLMLEGVGVFGALGRAVRLTRRQFWRLLGILVLVSLVVGVAGSMLRLPFSIVGEFFVVGGSDAGYGLTIYLLLTAVGTVLSSALLQPFQAAVSALLYVDQRIRKEAYDVELLGRAGILTG